jgi:O-methyltransferase
VKIPLTIRRFGFRLINALMWSLPPGVQKSFSIYHYDYMFTPAQLCFLCDCLNRTKGVPGSVVEIGCATGHTTVFLSLYINDISDNRQYIAIDTFKGFTREDLSYEYEMRAKRRGSLTKAFTLNKLERFNKTMKYHGIYRVRAVPTDINTFDFATIPGGISFCLLDVDLYRPTKYALQKIHEILKDGGIVVIDDCDPNVQVFDGAWQAYSEFTQSNGVKSEIVLGKLGVIRKPQS